MSRIIRDNIYKHVKVSSLALQFIDTYEFQRLRRIKQTSTSYFVYPSATHSRFEHSIGVYHLTGLFLQKLNMDISKRLMEVIKLAGLLHDIGHMAFSHTFDHYIIPYLSNKSELKEHEYRALELIEHMNKKYEIGLDTDELNIIKACIMGEYYKDYPKYLFQIVNNKKNGIDVDKMDYLLRDSFYINNMNPYDFSYILSMTKVVNNELSFHEKTMIQIYKMLNTRFILHKEFYQHKTAIITELMIADLILENKDYLKLNDIHKDFKWCEITDDIIYKVPNDKLLKRINKRHFYKKTSNSNDTMFKKKISYNPINDFFFKINFHDNNKKKVIYDTVPIIFNICLEETEIFYINKDE